MEETRCRIFEADTVYTYTDKNSTTDKNACVGVYGIYGYTLFKGATCTEYIVLYFMLMEDITSDAIGSGNRRDWCICTLRAVYTYILIKTLLQRVSVFTVYTGTQNVYSYPRAPCTRRGGLPC